MIKVENIEKDTKKCTACLTGIAKVRHRILNSKYEIVFDLCFSCESVLHEQSAPVTG